MPMRKPLTTHVGRDYVAILREGQTTDEAICTIKYPSKATIALAKKMAAAEEMLNALRVASAYFTNIGPLTDYNSGTAATVRGAIAKAEGRS